jgi:transcriptional regulator with XRE-family HTH domain
MISVRYKEFFEILSARRRASGVKGKLTRKEVSEKSGVQAKVLSKLSSDPTAEITLETINKLASFFFTEFVKAPPEGLKNKHEILDWVWRNLVEFIPDILLPKEEYREQILKRDPIQRQILTRDQLVGQFLKNKSK